ncbi:iron-sulfur flavoprotein [Oxobacter pfennigii]|uniref:Iron-sulfur flavoprotein n=1 Tax=Oxobacter pfennigii TaxID=36849 RepID=A0A0P8WAN0_9CLOT|nr:flavodoxin family protein [Oxobacter pfennigii]KPU44772.1 iron-sulfur flavoprotein [Oxobacter pfennigii]
MKIVAINGSPKGKTGNTNVMVSSFLKGAQESGAETVNIFLAEKEIKHCRGCHICWSKGPCQCVISDDMLGVISLIGGADVVVFATPVYFANISGMLKVFMDRMTMIGSPHPPQGAKAEGGDSNSTGALTPKFVVISSCGYSDRSEFEVISLWIKRVALKMRSEVIGEIYATQGKYLTERAEELKLSISSYLSVLKAAGEEIATGMKLSETTQSLLEKGIAFK